MTLAILFFSLLILGIGFFSWQRLQSIQKVSAALDEARDVEKQSPGVIRTPAWTPKHPIEKAVASFLQNFSVAIQNKSLVQFSVENGLTDPRRSIARCSDLLRPIAGWALLIGLIVTLSNLQASVGKLSDAFKNIAKTSRAGSTAPSRSSRIDAGQLVQGQVPKTSPAAGGPGKFLTEAAELQARMADVAGAAAIAFRWGLGFIGVALAATFAAALLERRAHALVSDLSSWAHSVHGRMLPSQMPITHGDLARELQESARAMNSVVDRLSSATSELSNLSGLVGSMTAVSDTIRDAMGRLPQDLRNSMSNISSELVQGLTTTLGESNEHTKKILQIYADQEFRIREIRGFVESMNVSADSMKTSASTMSGIPKAIDALNASTRENSVAAGKIAKAASDLTSKLPLTELAAALNSIQAMQDVFVDMQQQSDATFKKLVSTTESLSGKNGTIPEIRKLLERFALLHKTFQQTMEKLSSEWANDADRKAVLALADRMLSVLDALRTKAGTHEWLLVVDELRENVTAARNEVRGPVEDTPHKVDPYIFPHINVGMAEASSVKPTDPGGKFSRTAELRQKLGLGPREDVEGSGPSAYQGKAYGRRDSPKPDHPLLYTADDRPYVVTGKPPTEDVK